MNGWRNRQKNEQVNLLAQIFGVEYGLAKMLQPCHHFAL